MPAPHPFPRMPVLSEHGVTLRPWRLADAPAMAGASADPEIVRWTNHPAGMSAAAAADYVQSTLDHVADGQLAYFAIVDDADAVVGAIGVGGFDWVSDVGQVFYWIAAPARGRGLATAAVRLVARWAFGALGLARLELYTMPGNAASERVAEKAGFTREGVLRSRRLIKGERTDVTLFALLPDDPVT